MSSSTRLTRSLVDVASGRVPVCQGVGVQSGEGRAERGRALASLAWVARHKGTDGVTLELISGFGFNGKGAVAKEAETILKGFRACGCKRHNPNRQLSLLALVIPELRLRTRGSWMRPNSNLFP